MEAATATPTSAFTIFALTDTLSAQGFSYPDRFLIDSLQANLGIIPDRYPLFYFSLSVLGVTGEIQPKIV